MQVSASLLRLRCRVTNSLRSLSSFIAVAIKILKSKFHRNMAKIECATEEEIHRRISKQINTNKIECNEKENEMNEKRKLCFQRNPTWNLCDPQCYRRSVTKAEHQLNEHCCSINFKVTWKVNLKLKHQQPLLTSTSNNNSSSNEHRK